jgi:hypothetical protein
VSSVSTGFPIAKSPSSDPPDEVNRNSPISCLPRWSAKTIEVVGDVSSWTTDLKSKAIAKISLMNHVLETSDRFTYLDAEGHPEWEEAMQTKIDSLTKNHTWDLVP